MSTKQFYANRFGNELSESQVNKKGDFLIKFYDNEVLIKIEAYSNGELSGTSYNLMSEDTIPLILESDPNASFQINSQSGNFTLAECLLYQNKILVGKQIFLNTISSGLMICRHLFDPVSNALVHTSTIKKYYDMSGKLIYEFEYLEDGACFYVNAMNPYDDSFLASDIGADPDLDFIWQGFEYYQFSDPLIPLPV